MLLAVNELFWISGWIFVLLVATVWLAKRPAATGPVAAH